MIDRATVERIKEASNIVDVVSEFVTLHKSGANYKGLCPFHDEKTPSFFVSPARGTCHCFGCGKGGNAVSFIMEHEQLSYPEALRWLAKKYSIDIRERELSDDEKKEQSERESMYIVNEWASGYFSDILHNNVDGVAFGLQYFRSRGFRDDIIDKFHLGYSLHDRKALGLAALSKGYKEQYLLTSGLCYKNDQSEFIDRYAGRVIFPWIGLSGKVVGFGGRLLDQRTKGVNQKYVNSPESDIYHKDHELYGIYQAKRAIAKNDFVYLVEGYTDVISMHQNGIENVVANSGTALSIYQIHVLHRFTSNITLLYDGDEAGIHAALRGTDMLLSEGMNLRVLLLPGGDDPDSFARKHNSTEFRDFVDKNQTDFIRFKMRLLLDRETDPVKRTEAINSIVRSIALVLDPILRDTYIHECSSYLKIPEGTLINTMNRYIRETRKQALGSPVLAPPTISVNRHANATVNRNDVKEDAQLLLIKTVILKGERYIYRGVEDFDGHLRDFTVAQYIAYDLSADNLSFDTDLYNLILKEAVEHSGDTDFVSIDYFVHHHDIAVSQLASSLSIDDFQLHASKDETGGFTKPEKKEEKEIEQLQAYVTHLLIDYRVDYLDRRLSSLKMQISQVSSNGGKLDSLMKQFNELQMIRNGVAKKIGRRLR
jgi:DNA primase